MAFITCENLSLGYEGNIVTKDINFQVNKGDYLCVVGENGAGKSTLMKTLLHLQNPISGEIKYDEGLMPYEIGYLPQQTIVQKDFPASVWEIVLSGTLSKCGKYAFFTKKQKDEAKENMKRMEIWELRHKSYRNLSGGQQQRVLLARALCATTKLLLLDEPVSGLDPKVTLEFYKLIKQLNDNGITVIMVSHDVQAAINYSSHILHVGRQQLFYGTTSEYLNSSSWKMFKAMEGEL